MPDWLRLPPTPDRRATWLVIALGVVLTLPGLGAGWMADDYIQQAALAGRAPEQGQGLDLFAFADGNRAHNLARIAHGPFPWWTAPDLLLRFCRPLSSALMHLDLALENGSGLWSHAHSILWYALCLGAVATLLARTLGGPLAVLASVLYAVDEAHFLPVIWLANRNALVAVVPALWGLVAWQRFREDCWTPGKWLWPLGLLAGLSGGETALGVAGLWAAYEAMPLAQRADWPRIQHRALAWLATGGTLLFWAVPYKWMGFGARGSGAYLDPLGEPWAFASHAPARILGLTGAMGLGSPVDAWAVSARLALPLALAGVAALALFGALWRRLGHGLDARQLQGLLWLSAGGALAMVPAAATFPSNRVLLVPTIASAAWVAWALLRLGTLASSDWTLAAGAKTSGWPKWLGVWLAGAHLIVAPLLLLVGSGGIGFVARAAEHQLLRPEIERLQGHIAVLPLAPDPIVGFYTPSIWQARGAPAPDAWWCFSMTRADHTLHRTGLRSFELTSLGGPMLSTTAEHLLRSPQAAFHVGDTVAVPGYRVTVLALQDGLPVRLGVAFARDLDDPLYAWLQWQDGALQPLTLPRVGEAVRLRRSAGVLGL